MLLAVLLSSMGSQATGGASSDPWMRPAAARTATPPAVDLRLRFPKDQFDLKSLIPKHPPIEVKSMKVVGASGVGIYFPAADAIAAGVGVTAFKIAPQKRATQVVFGLRFRF